MYSPTSENSAGECEPRERLGARFSACSLCCRFQEASDWLELRRGGWHAPAVSGVCNNRGWVRDEVTYATAIPTSSNITGRKPPRYASIKNASPPYRPSEIRSYEKAKNRRRFPDDKFSFSFFNTLLRSVFPRLTRAHRQDGMFY